LEPAFGLLGGAPNSTSQVSCEQTAFGRTLAVCIPFSLPGQPNYQEVTTLDGKPPLGVFLARAALRFLPEYNALSWIAAISSRRVISFGVPKMRKGFFLAICIFACSTASPSIASTITYDVSFDVDAVVHTVVGDVSASGTVDIKPTSDGPATQASDVITVPFTVTDVAVTSNNALLNALIPFVQDLLPSGLGTTFTYNLSANKVSLTEQFTFITATQVNIVSPFLTTGNSLSFDHADFSTLPGPERSISTAIFALVPLAAPSTSTLPLSRAQSSGLACQASLWLLQG
jgi:hypothetical protein